MTESIADFVADLRRLSIKINVSSGSSWIRLSVTASFVGCEALQKKLLKLTVKRVQEIAQSMETGDQSSKDLKEVEPTAPNVNSVKEKGHEKPKHCYRCGR